MKFFFSFFLPFFCNFANAQIYSDETAVAKYLKPVEISEFESGLNLVDCIYVINLDKRPEKWKRVKKSFDKRHLKVNRVSGIDGKLIPPSVLEELAGSYPNRLYPGEIGCLLAHVSVIKDAYERGFQIVWIAEDDMFFLDNVKLIPYLLTKLSRIDPDWDIFYTDIDSRSLDGGHNPSLGSDFRPDRVYEDRKHYHERTFVDYDIMKLGQRYGLYSTFMSRKGLKKVFDYFTHVYVWSPVDIEMHYIPGIRAYSVTQDIVTVCDPDSDTRDPTYDINP
jgi:hypothetical protein